MCQAQGGQGCRVRKGTQGWWGSSEPEPLHGTPSTASRADAGHATERAPEGFRGEVAAGWAGGF